MEEAEPKKVRLKSGLDYTHPLHRASVAVEEAKYGSVRDENKVEVIDDNSAIDVLKSLLDGAGLEDVDASMVLLDSRFYGLNYTKMLPGVSTSAAWSMFLDGLMHGIALGRIEPKDERVPPPGTPVNPAFTVEGAVVLSVEGQAEGAIPNGTRIRKIRSTEGDTIPDGALGKVRSSFGPVPLSELPLEYRDFPDAVYGYFVEWDDGVPGLPVMVAGHRIEEFRSRAPEPS